jgi:hypothetical protein
MLRSFLIKPRKLFANILLKDSALRVRPADTYIKATLTEITKQNSRLPYAQITKEGIALMGKDVPTPTEKQSSDQPTADDLYIIQII